MNQPRSFQGARINQSVFTVVQGDQINVDARRGHGKWETIVYQIYD